MAEAQDRHIRGQEQKVLDAQVKDRWIGRVIQISGQLFGFLIVMTVVIGSLVAIMKRPTAEVAAVAGTLGGATLIAVAGMFVLGRRRRRKRNLSGAAVGREQRAGTRNSRQGDTQT